MRPAAVLAACLVLLPACDSSTEPQVSIVDILVGEGPVADGRDIVTIGWVGMLENGTVFDSSEERGTLTFELETGIVQNLPNNQRVIDGLILGVPGMHVGGVRRITVPPELAYGRKSADPRIPDNATLVFQVHLLTLQEASVEKRSA